MERRVHDNIFLIIPKRNDNISTIKYTITIVVIDIFNLFLSLAGYIPPSFSREYSDEAILIHRGCY